MADAPRPCRSVSLTEKLRFLGAPDSHRPRPDRVDRVETHMSWVFLAGEQVYKLKKPLRLPFLDFRTLEARRHFVEEEVRLNRRLAADTYLGAVPLTCDAAGRLALGGGGEAVEWLVHMRRLPAERMLDRLIERGAADAGAVERLGRVLVDFYRQAERPSWSVARHLARTDRTFAEARAVLANPRFGLDAARLARLIGRHAAEAEAIRPLIEARVRQGRVVEGHGDLRPEHVCLTEPPQIFDCVEFDQALRMVDPFEEIALLGVEAARFGAGWIGGALYRRLAAALEQPAPPALMRFYWRDRALLRARLAIGHLLDAHPRTPAKWRPLCERYLVIAEQAEAVSARLSGEDAPRPRAAPESPPQRQARC